MIIIIILVIIIIIIFGDNYGLIQVAISPHIIIMLMVIFLDYDGEDFFVMIVMMISLPHHDQPIKYISGNNTYTIMRIIKMIFVIFHIVMKMSVVAKTFQKVMITTHT